MFCKRERGREGALRTGWGEWMQGDGVLSGFFAILHGERAEAKIFRFAIAKESFTVGSGSTRNPIYHPVRDGLSITFIVLS